MAKILISNDGPHSPETWAVTTAEMIVDIDPAAANHLHLAALKLRVAIAEALVPHHAAVQEQERSKLAADVQHIHTPHAADDYLDAVIAAIEQAAHGTALAGHFAKPEVQAAVKEVVANHFMTAQHIERLWHVDRNPDCEVSQQYKMKFHN